MNSNNTPGAGSGKSPAGSIAARMPASSGVSKVLRDEQAVASTVQFFGPNPTVDKRKRNYGNNVLSGQKGMLIKEVGVELSAGAIHFDGADADTNLSGIAALINNVRNAYMEISVGDNECQHENHSVGDFFTQEFSIPSDAAADMLVTLSAGQLVTLPQPVEVPPNTPYTVTLTIESTDGLGHTDANFDGNPSDALGLVCKLGVTEYPKEKYEQVAAQLAAATAGKAQLA